MYTTRGQTSSRLDSEVNKGADFFAAKLRSDSKMGVKDGGSDSDPAGRRTRITRTRITRNYKNWLQS